MDEKEERRRRVEKAVREEVERMVREWVEEQKRERNMQKVLREIAGGLMRDGQLQ